MEIYLWKAKIFSTLLQLKWLGICKTSKLKFKKKLQMILIVVTNPNLLMKM